MAKLPTAALAKMAKEVYGGEAVAFDGIDNAPEERERGITSNITRWRTQQDTRT